MKPKKGGVKCMRFIQELPKENPMENENKNEIKKKKIEPNLSDLPEILVAPEVAKVLRIGRVKAYEMMKSGEITSFMVGKKGIRTTKQALLNYIHGRSEKNG